ncbi:MAG: hypothetical protein ACRD5M_14155 [Candidatus Acidiferrales bacterium]
MRKRLLIAFAAILVSAIAATPLEAKQSADPAKHDETSTEKMSKKTISITGKVSPDGLTLIVDKESKTYKVINPDFLKENAGDHVRVSAHVSKDMTEIQVTSVMIENAEPVVAKKDDSAFRR